MSDFTNPLQSFTQGYGVGSQILQQRQASEAARAAAAREAQINAMFGQLQSGEATAQDYVNLAAMLPEERSKPVREAYALLTEDQQRTALNQQGQVFAAFRSGSPEIATALLDRNVEALRNSGDEQGAQLMETWSKVAKTGPDGAKAAENFFGFNISQIPGGDTVIDSATQLSKERRDEAIQEGELLKIANDLNLSGEEKQRAMKIAADNNLQTARLILEFAADTKAGNIDSKDVFAFERKLSDDYQKSIGNYNEIVASNDAVKSVGDLQTGAGDQALIVLFNKMLDPGSVVRESEAAATMRSQGVIDQLKAGISRLATGEKLSPNLRNDLLAATEQLMKAAENIESRARKRLEPPVKNWGLNADNVFGPSERIVEEPEQAAKLGTLSQLRTYIKQNNPNTQADVDMMTEEEIRAAFPNGYNTFISQAAPVENTIKVDF
jgi:hypothetical protein